LNARLDPRIVAARIHGAAAAEHGAAAGAESMTPSSDGCTVGVLPIGADLSPENRAFLRLAGSSRRHSGPFAGNPNRQPEI